VVVIMVVVSLSTTALVVVIMVVVSLSATALVVVIMVVVSLSATAPVVVIMVVGLFVVLMMPMPTTASAALYRAPETGCWGFFKLELLIGGEGFGSLW
jgi:hypothetical protein